MDEHWSVMLPKRLQMQGVSTTSTLVTDQIASVICSSKSSMLAAHTLCAFTLLSVFFYFHAASNPMSPMSSVPPPPLLPPTRSVCVPPSETRMALESDGGQQRC